MRSAYQHKAAYSSQILITFFLSLVLSACNPEKGPSFQTRDITGANYGRDFRLRDPDQHERTLADFRGKIVMVFFGFTQCPDICPTTLLRAAEIYRLLGADAEHLQVILISLDPERDTPEILHAYTSAFNPSFIGLSTDPENTQQVAKEFRVFYRKVPAGDTYTLDHSAESYIFDQQGTLRLAVSYKNTAEAIAADIRTLLYSRPAP